MANRNFANLSSSDCLKIYESILKNSDTKWESAKKIAKSDYGSATSLAIISVEESIKALVICMDGNGFEFRRVKGMDAFFHRHQVRYLVAFAMMLLNILSEELMKLITHLRSKPGELQVWTKQLKENSFFNFRVKFYLLRKALALRREFKWFSKIDLFRQDGFYSDYQDELKSPLQVTKKDYEGLMLRMEKVRLATKALIDYVSHPTAEQGNSFDDLKAFLKNENVYDKIGESLTSIRSSRENPFDKILNDIDEAGNRANII
jgi:AbiV family abortive infection protein